MSDLLNDYKNAALALLSAISGILTALWVRMNGQMDSLTARVSSLEKTAVTRDELEKKFNEMRDDRKSMHQENTASLRRIEDKIDASQPGVIAAKLLRAEKDIDDLRDWKHSVDPFIERRVEP